MRGDVTPLVDGMRVTAVNTVGGLERDRARFIEWLAPFLPVGFYYKAFHGQRFPRWERRIRAMSGLGAIAANAPRTRTPKRYAFCDVLVIGAGPSGLAAALSAADAGARVLLVDENARAGGCGRWSGAAAGEIESIIDRVAAIFQHRSCCSSTYAAGYYADHWVALVEPTRMTKVRAGAVVFATGVIEQPAVFRNNDLPGVMSGSAAQRLLHRHGIAPGKRVAILTANREGYELARDTAFTLESPWRPCSICVQGPAATPMDSATCAVVAGVIPQEAIAGRGGAVRALRIRTATDESAARAKPLPAMPCS